MWLTQTEHMSTVFTDSMAAKTVFCDGRSAAQGEGPEPMLANLKLATDDLTLDWTRGSTGHYFQLSDVARRAGLPMARGLGGVYVLWRGGRDRRCIVVGQSRDIAESLHRLGCDRLIRGFTSANGLYVTWAAVAQSDRDGIERYVAEQLQPLIDSRPLRAAPIPVNLP